MTHELIDFVPGPYKERSGTLLFKEKLLCNGILTEEEIKAIDDRAKERIDEAVRFAIESPYPSEEEITSDVYAR